MKRAQARDPAAAPADRNRNFASGAVIRDMTEILARGFRACTSGFIRRWCRAKDRSKRCAGHRIFQRSGWPDVVIVARGGGSLEDLWTFNEEAVARAIAASKVPVISAVGHETDYTIADFVADLRAPTPSAAAELVICTQEQLGEQIGVAEHKLLQSMRYRLAMAARRLHQRGVERASAVLHRNIGRLQQRVDELDFRIRDRTSGGSTHAAQTPGGTDHASAQPGSTVAIRRGAPAAGERQRGRAATDALGSNTRAGPLNPLLAHLTQLSPLKILDRGYAIVTNEAGGIVKQPADAPRNQGSIFASRREKSPAGCSKAGSPSF